jgi:hypothetical protein
VTQKLLLISVILASVAIPVRAARDPDPRRGLRSAVALTAAFDFLYLIAVKYLYWYVL